MNNKYQLALDLYHEWQSDPAPHNTVGNFDEWLIKKMIDDEEPVHSGEAPNDNSGIMAAPKPCAECIYSHNGTAYRGSMKCGFCIYAKFDTKILSNNFERTAS
jgi:hypothetical protein